MKRKNRIKISLLLISLIAMFSCSILYGKSIDLNGVKINLNSDVKKENLNIGKKVDEEEIDEKESKKSEREPKDKSVNIELTIRNNNPYETANVTIVEKVNSGFKQLGTNKVDRKIKFKLESNKEKTYKYNYKYEKHFILDQFNKLIYGDNDTYEEVNNDDSVNIGDKNVNIENNGNIKGYIDNSKNKIIEETKKKKTKGSNIFLIIFITIVIGLAVIYGFTIFLRSLNDKDIDFDNLDKYNGFIIILVLSFVISIIGKTNIYASSYEPILYQKAESLTKTITETVLFNERYYNFSYEIMFKYDNKNEITDYETDTDGDLLVDAMEYLYMTDINNKDTDGDGLSDYLEVMILNYNPNSKWTFNDGRNDGYRDYDGDGLRNKKEVEVGTDPTVYDSDSDNLDDYEEINGIKSKDGIKTYQTNPLLKDTDGDGLNDDIEIKLGLDPTNRMTDGTTLDGKRKIKQDLNLSKLSNSLTSGTFPIIKVTSSISGLIEENIKIKEYSNPNFEKSELIIGKPLKIDLIDDTDKVKISIDCSYYGERVKKLMFVKYEDNEMKPVETTSNGSIVSADLRSGEYGMIDVEMYLRKMNIYLGDYD